jgi:hypothetical protein
VVLTMAMFIWKDWVMTAQLVKTLTTTALLIKGDLIVAVLFVGNLVVNDIVDYWLFPRPQSLLTSRATADITNIDSSNCTLLNAGSGGDDAHVDHVDDDCPKGESYDLFPLGITLNSFSSDTRLFASYSTW